MGILEELGLTEDDLNPFNHPPSVAGEPIPEEALDAADAAEAAERAEAKQAAAEQAEVPSPGVTGVDPDDFFQPLRNGPVEVPEPPPDSAPAKTKPKSKSKRVVYSVRCTLNLSGSDYAVELLPPRDGYDKAYRLTKVDAQKPTGYNVVQIDGEIVCECYDFRYRQDSSEGSKGCKHVRGLVDMGFFMAPPPSTRIRSQIFGD